MPYIIKNGIAYAGNAVTVTQAQYDALSEAEKKNGTVYYIYDSDALLDASDVSYDNSSSGLSATNVQVAVDEVKNGLSNKIKYIDIDLAGKAVTRADSGWYYANVTVSLPTGAKLFAVATLGTWDANTFYAIDGSTNGISVRSSVSKTLSANSKARCFYYIQ